jgi:hypothetical protein
MISWLAALVENNNEVVIGAAYACMAVVYSLVRKRSYLFLSMMVIAALTVLVAFSAQVFVPDEGPLFKQVVALLLVYGFSLYVVLCDILKSLASYLTKKRGEKWVKELDYPYLFLGALGIIASTNRLDIFSGRISRVDILGPLVLTTAVVIRCVKTRADIAGWNKLP